MDSNRDIFWVMCTESSILQRQQIDAHVRTIIGKSFDSEGEMLDSLVQTVHRISQILTNWLVLNENQVYEHILQKIGIVRCNQNMCDCRQFRNNADFRDCFRLLERLNHKIQEGLVISSNRKMTKRMRRLSNV